MSFGARNHSSSLIRTVVGLVQASLKVTIGSSKGRAHASHPGGAVFNESKALVVGLCRSSLARRPKRFFLRHLKNTAEQLLCSVQDLAGELSDLDHVVKANAKMCFTQPQFFWMFAPTSWLVCLRNVVTQDKRCSCGSRRFRSPSRSRYPEALHYVCALS